MARERTRVRDADGLWEEQRDPGTKELLVRVLLEPTPAFVRRERLEELQARETANKAVVLAVENVEKATTVAELRDIVARFLKKDLRHDRAVKELQELDDLKQEDNPDDPRNPRPTPEGPLPGRGNPLPG